MTPIQKATEFMIAEKYQFSTNAGYLVHWHMTSLTCYARKFVTLVDKLPACLPPRNNKTENLSLGYHPKLKKGFALKSYVTSRNSQLLLLITELLGKGREKKKRNPKTTHPHPPTPPKH